MMGLKDEIFHLSWFLTYALQVIYFLSSIPVLPLFVLDMNQVCSICLYYGLSSVSYDLCFLQFAISSAIITGCTMGTLFKYSDKSLVFMYFFMFGLSAIMLSFLISTFFTRAKSAVAVGTLAFLGAFFPYYTVNDEAVSM